MPTLGIYVSEEIYTWLASQGKAVSVGKQILEEKYREETKEK